MDNIKPLFDKLARHEMSADIKNAILERVHHERLRKMRMREINNILLAGSGSVAIIAITIWLFIHFDMVIDISLPMIDFSGALIWIVVAISTLIMLILEHYIVRKIRQQE